MSNLAISVKAEFIENFKKALSKWSQEKYGALAPDLGGKITIKESKAFKIVQISLDTLAEQRTKENIIVPSKDRSLTKSPIVHSTAVDIWKFSTPDHFTQNFSESLMEHSYPGTEFYVACTPCAETGAIGCTTCNQHGVLTCGECDGTRKVDCPSCNGFGEFNCATCDGTSEVTERCSICYRGQVDCEGCGGAGYHTRNFENYDCNLCNRSGKKRCPKCGGDGEQTVKCTSCRGGSIPCTTCRTQKQVVCTNCDSNGNVTCGTCKGKKTVQCRPCKGEGGHRHHVQVTATTTVTPNSLVLSPIDKISEKLQPLFSKKVQDFRKTYSLQEIIDLAKDESLTSYINELFSHVQTLKNNATLLEQFTVGETQVLSVEFDYLGNLGKALFDINSSKLFFEQDPLTHLQKNLNGNLENKFNAALATSDYLKCKEIINEAQNNKLSILVTQMQNRMNQQIKKQDENKRLKKGKFIQRYAYFALASICWFLVGFVMPVSLTLLCVILFFTYEICAHHKDFKAVPTDENFKEAKKSYVKLAVLLVAIMACNWFYVRDVEETDFMKYLNKGVKVVRK